MYPPTPTPPPHTHTRTPPLYPTQRTPSPSTPTRVPPMYTQRRPLPTYTSPPRTPPFTPPHGPPSFTPPPPHKCNRPHVLPTYSMYPTQNTLPTYAIPLPNPPFHEFLKHTLSPQISPHPTKNQKQKLCKINAKCNAENVRLALNALNFFKIYAQKLILHKFDAFNASLTYFCIF